MQIKFVGGGGWGDGGLSIDYWLFPAPTIVMILAFENPVPVDLLLLILFSNRSMKHLRSVMRIEYELLFVIL